MIEEKPALLRLKIKVYLGTLGISKPNIWDEPSVMVEGIKTKPTPDLIVAMVEGIWWWEIKDWKGPVSSAPIKELSKVIKKLNKSDNVRFVRKDGRKEIVNKKIAKVTVICGEGGFSAPAFRLGRESNFYLMEPEDLKVDVVIIPRIDQKNNCLLGVEIRIVPKGSRETFVVPEDFQTSTSQ